uniref:Uncharacterized protein n=1 Tax=Ixodes ricinus TaxID=34613 RepID=A0A147BX62_IXORI
MPKCVHFFFCFSQGHGSHSSKYGPRARNSVLRFLSVSLFLLRALSFSLALADSFFCSSDVFLICCFSFFFLEFLFQLACKIFPMALPPCLVTASMANCLTMVHAWCLN